MKLCLPRIYVCFVFLLTLSACQNDNSLRFDTEQTSPPLHLLSTHRTLHPSWQLISFPLRQTTPIAEFLQNQPNFSFHTIWSWDAFSQDWQVYPKTDNYALIETLEPQKGYWVRNSNTTFIQSRVDKAPEFYLLSSGWNLIGYSPYDEETLSLEKFLRSAEYKTILCNTVHPVESIWAWNQNQWKIHFPQSGQLSQFNQTHGTSFLELSNLSPGMGIWIKTNETLGLWKKDRNLEIPQSTGCETAEAGQSGLGDAIYANQGNGGIDVLSYDISLTVNPSNKTLEGQSHMLIKALQNLTAFNLDFYSMTVDRILINDVETTYSREGSELTIHLPSSQSMDSEFSAIIFYSGIPSSIVDQGFAIGWRQFSNGESFVMSQPTGAPTWYPVNDSVLDKATYKFNITVPQEYTVAANGQLKQQSTNEGQTTFHWEAIDPMVSYLVTVNIFSSLELETDTTASVPIYHYFPKNYAHKSYFDRVPEMLTFFSSKFGPYPFESFGSVVINSSLGLALETQTLPVYGSGIVSSLGERVVAHELAHQWFGDSVSTKNWRNDLWINAGMATFSEWLWTEHTEGSAAYQTKVTNDYSKMGAKILYWEFSPSDWGPDNLFKPSTLMSQEDAIAFVQLFGNVITQKQLQETIQLIPGEGILYPDLSNLIYPLSSESTWLANWQLYEVFKNYPTLNSWGHPALGPYGPPGIPPNDELFSYTVYHRGALVFAALRAKLGDTLFFEILQTFAERYKNGNASTVNLMTLVQEKSQQDMTSFFDQWLYQWEFPDIPELNLSLKDWWQGPGSTNTKATNHTFYSNQSIHSTPRSDTPLENVPLKY